ncbi:MAG TPA: GNAT family N-acetyltransferase, partial [Chthonomonadaceae bacterium]|nr:GNAT family N-acetyltransferase [Chthonomonadaceae bacterium]
SHGTQADPVFSYGNATALRLFEMRWEEFTALPSRLSAEPVHRDERQRMMDEVTRNGFIASYGGIRISRNGRRFAISNATVWNVVDDAGRYTGQAAKFTEWRFLDGGPPVQPPARPAGANADGPTDPAPGDRSGERERAGSVPGDRAAQSVRDRPGPVVADASRPLTPDPWRPVAVERLVDGFLVSTDPARLDLDAVCGFLARSYWAAGRPRAVIERSIANSLCIGIYAPHVAAHARDLPPDESDVFVSPRNVEAAPRRPSDGGAAGGPDERRAAGRQVAFARVVTDYATFAWLCDVFVEEEFRGRGLGKALVETALAHPALQGLRRWLLATADAHVLYRQHGFVDLTAPERWMERFTP